MIKEFDPRALFRRYRIVFLRVPAVFWQLIDFSWRHTFLGGFPGRGADEFEGGFANADRDGRDVSVNCFR
ncbi:hypothetical protein [Streptomyces sp. 11x1]|uniref:hypothetical protein n=1 Tax=Streptomyces sp. 11x1 TaxID=3038642 RepID=UPI00292D5DBD|nr:hypothetical protein [Streptomyces sp. 11x1]WNZ10530.1 hypothetical protein P8T65_25125 [Streptomyces sp. 11x1]